MRAAITPDALVSAARYLDDVGADGFLLSGGSDATGKVPLERFAGAVKEVKETTALRINAHVGLMPRAGLESLVSAGVDAFSVDVYGADSAVQGTLGLQAQANDFLKVVENLKDLGAPVIAPHVCIGIECGRLVGEMRAIGHLRALKPEEITDHQVRHILEVGG